MVDQPVSTNLIEGKSLNMNWTEGRLCGATGMIRFGLVSAIQRTNPLQMM